MGNTSSHGQHSQAVSHSGLMGLDFGQINSQIVTDPALTPIASNEVLQAAALLQNVPNRQSHGLDDAEFLRNREARFLSGERSVGMGVMSQPLSILPPVFEPRSSAQCYSNDPVQADTIFDDHSAAFIRNRGVNAGSDIRWGSDAAFTGPQGFITPSSRENFSAAERYHLHAIETALSLSPNQASTEITRPPRQEVKKSSTSHQRMNSNGRNFIENDKDLLANKRRKIESQEKEDEDEDEDSQTSSLLTSKATATTLGKKRKTVMRESVDSSSLESESNHKRRKSIASATAKSTRENLTEEQKRENHIKSEQKRRTLIREGFEDLNELVPGLQGGGFSKSAILAQAADWLEDLIQGNENLLAKILILEGRIANNNV